MHSRIYKGWVEHRRATPRAHAFRYSVFMLYLDLAELPRLFEGIPFWSARRRALAYFKRADYLAPATVPLDVAVRDLVERRLGARPCGPIRLLTHLRYFGYCMNPVSFYYCFDVSGERLQWIVAEITNTPWGERHQYVLEVGAEQGLKRFEFGKQFHVSPFMPMDMRYRWAFNVPNKRLMVDMRSLHGDEQAFRAILHLQAQPVTRANLLKTLATFPFMTLKVISAIHWQAFRLWLKRTPFYGHPRSITR